MIPAEAVEAALETSLRQLGLWGKNLPNDLIEARRAQLTVILDAAAPYIVAAALREAADHLEYGNPINDWLYERADEIAPTNAV